jgi:hypothetical protein
LLKSAQLEAETILEAHRPDLDALAKALLDKEALEAEEIAALLAAVPKWHRVGDLSGIIEPGPHEHQEQTAAA